MGSQTFKICTYLYKKFLQNHQEKVKIHHLRCYTFCPKMFPKINGKDLIVEISWLHFEQDSVALKLFRLSCNTILWQSFRMPKVFFGFFFLF